MLSTKQTLTLAAARHIAQAAEKYARSSDLPVVIAIMDDGANLLYFERMDGAPIGSVEVALRKAKSAANFKRETKDFETKLASGAQGLLSLDLVALEGGVPIDVEGAVLGAIGVSGASSAQDGAIARVGLKALNDSLQDKPAGK